MATPHATVEPRVAARSLSGRSLAQIGCGLLGGSFAPAAVQCGARLTLVDPELGEVANLVNQEVEPGVPKAESLARRCAAIVPGSVTPLVTDVRHVGPGVLLQHDLLLDLTDDPGLRGHFARLGNGLGLPVLRAAVDAAGTALGRVRASHGGSGHACFECGSGSAPAGAPVSCPGGPRAMRAPTLAAPPIGQATAALALHQVRSLLCGVAPEQVLDREVYLSLDELRIVAFDTPRQERCPSGHARWQLCATGLEAGETTLEGLFEHAAGELASSSVELEPFEHPLWLECRCPRCGRLETAPGSRWAPVPACPDCGQAMERRPELARARFDREFARALDIARRTPLELGWPEHGALIAARAPGKDEIHLLLR